MYLPFHLLEPNTLERTLIPDAYVSKLILLLGLLRSTFVKISTYLGEINLLVLAGILFLPTQNTLD